MQMITLTNNKVWSILRANWEIIQIESKMATNVKEQGSVKINFNCLTHKILQAARKTFRKKMIVDYEKKKEI